MAAALEHGNGLVLGQTKAPDKSNEVPDCVISAVKEADAAWW